MVKLNMDVKVFFTIFIGVIIGVVLLSSAADTVFLSTNNFNQSNATITTPAVSVVTAIEGRELVGTAAVWNGSFLVPSSNVTVSDQNLNGTQTVTVLVENASFASVPLNFSYVFVPDGNVPGVGGTVLRLVLIFGSLAILIFVIFKVVKEGSMRNFMEKG